MRSPLKRSGKFLKRTRIKKKPRSKEDTARIYGPRGRIQFVQSLPCAACGIKGFSVNAHLTPKGEKGTGYKGHYRFIAPMCGASPEREVAFGTIYVGCHTLYDEHRPVFRTFFPDFDPVKAAADCERLWLEHSRSREAVK